MVKHIDYSSLINLATEAANAAGDEWMKNACPMYKVVGDGPNGSKINYGTMLDVCGIVYISIHDHRTKFSKWVKNYQNGWDHSLRIPHKYSMRQELGLLEACYRAACKVLIDNGVKGIYVYSNID